MTKLQQIKNILDLRRHLTYRNIVRNLPFVLFLAGLSVFYIWNSHWAQKNVRKINKVSKQVKELRWEYMSTKSDLMYKSKQSEVAEEVGSLGLHELRTPPKKIVIEDNGH